MDPVITDMGIDFKVLYVLIVYSVQIIILIASHQSHASVTLQNFTGQSQAVS